MKFRFSPDFIVDTEKSPWKTEGLRVGIWGGSGSGKSSTAALLGEQFLSQGGVLVVIEPRAEYQTLKEKFDVVVCGGPYSKDLDFVPSSPATYAKAVVEQGVSIVFYTSDVEDETKLVEFISKFIRYLLKYNEVTKRPVMLIAEETEEYGPINTKGRVSPPWVFSRMIRQLKNAQRDARKLNIVIVFLSPRPQEVNFTLRQLCNLTMFGKFSAQDATYVDRECLKPLREKGQCFYKGADLIHLETGRFAVILSGKAIPIQTITQPRLTTHGAVTPKLKYTAPRTEQTRKAVTDLAKTIERALEKERREQSALEKAKGKIKDLESRLEDAEEKAKIKMSVKEMLQAGTEPAELAEKLAEEKRKREIDAVAIDTLRKDLEKANSKTDELEKQNSKAVELISELKEKLAAFEHFEEALFGLLQPRLVKLLKILKQASPPGFEPGTVPQEHDIQLQTTTTIVDVPMKEETVLISTDTIRGKVLRLAKKGFLNKWQGLGDVHKALIEEFGWTLAKASLQRELNRMVDDFLLGAKRDPGRKQRVYRLAANVKFKEAEV